MHQKITKYPVQHPLLKKYIKFFWEIRADHMQLDHKIVPLRNINLRFNLSDTPHFIYQNGKLQSLSDVFFSGLHDQFMDIQLKLEGKVHMFGICFYPEGFYPFTRIPVSEFKNRVYGADEIGLHLMYTMKEALINEPSTDERLNLLENELMKLLSFQTTELDYFQQLFWTLKNSNYTRTLSSFCKHNNVGTRKLERLFNKYVGVSAKSFSTMNRFQNGLNQLLYHGDFSKLSDIAYQNGYFDQMHYIRDFKRFTGRTPQEFIQKRNSLLQVGKFV